MSVRVGWLTLGLALLLGGCLSRSPATAFYGLRGTAGGDVSASAAEGLAIRVGPADLPRYLQRPQMARRTGENAISYDEFNRWASPLEAELLRAVGANLATLLQTERVVVYPSEAPFPLDYRVAIAVDRFDAGPGDTVTLRANWVIRPGRGADALAVGLTHVVKPSGSDSDEVAAAHSAALESMSREIVAKLRTLQTARAVREEP